MRRSEELSDQMYCKSINVSDTIQNFKCVCDSVCHPKSCLPSDHVEVKANVWMYLDGEDTYFTDSDVKIDTCYGTLIHM